MIMFLIYWGNYLDGKQTQKMKFQLHFKHFHILGLCFCSFWLVFFFFLDRCTHWGNYLHGIIFNKPSQSSSASLPRHTNGNSLNIIVTFKLFNSFSFFCFRWWVEIVVEGGWDVGSGWGSTVVPLSYSVQCTTSMF